MKKEKRVTVRERLFWAYANLAMADMAVGRGEKKFKTLHYMVRARLNRGLLNGTMSPRTMMKDQKVRMKLPMECVYCGDGEKLSIDHIVPINRGGSDIGDNVVWACRSCNSSKSNSDFFKWWFSKRDGFPPLFVVRVYLKQAILYFTEHNRLDENWLVVTETPFDLASIPEEFPSPDHMRFTFYHERIRKQVECSIKGIEKR